MNRRITVLQTLSDKIETYKQYIKVMSRFMKLMISVIYGRFFELLKAMISGRYRNELNMLVW